MEKEIGLGYTLKTVSNFKTPEMVEICTIWSARTQGKPDVVPRTTAWLVNNLVFATLVYAPDKTLVATAGIVRSYEEKQPVYYTAEDNQIFPVYELVSNVVLHEGMGIGKRMMAERLMFADENKWATTTVTKNVAIIANAKGLGMVQTSKSSDKPIRQLGRQIRTCNCKNPDSEVPFYGSPCDTCPLNADKNSKRIFFRPPCVSIIALHMLHEKKEKA